MKKYSYTLEPNIPDSGTVNISILVAIRVARKFGDRVPDVQELMKFLGCSRATAYRWINAMTWDSRVSK